VLPVSHERENHPEGQLVGKHQSCREVDGDDRFQAEDQIVDGAEGNFSSPESHVRIHYFGVAVQPLAFPLALAIEELEALNRSDALDEIRVFLCAGLNRRFRAKPQDPVEGQTQRRVKQERPDDDEGEDGAVDEDHCKREKRHNAVDHCRNHALRQEITNGLERGEPGENIADVPLKKEAGKRIR
jgi:hypothetical protein